MNTYLSIGKVAKLKNVSIKSLRYYDDIGILKPVYVNAETNYRYYAEEQLYFLDAISLCLELGIPLKSLHGYVRNGSTDLELLFADCEKLAALRIKNIGESLHKLQETITLTNAATFTAAPRTLFTILLDEDTTPKYYGQYILQLFVQAQQLGLTVGYPSGILYRNEDDCLQKHMFLQVSGSDGQSFSLQEAADWQCSHTDAAGRLLCLPEASCSHKYLEAHIDSDAFSHFAPIAGDIAEYLLLESDVMDASLKDTGYLYELILYHLPTGQ